jgi:hypothetical protein
MEERRIDYEPYVQRKKVPAIPTKARKVTHILDYQVEGEHHVSKNKGRVGMGPGAKIGSTTL